MPPVSMLIKPASSSCNMRCRYCFYADVASHREVRNAGIMNEQTHENMVRRAMEYTEGSVSFAFQGGEPTLAGLDFFRRHMSFCKKYAKTGVQIHNSLQTNGYAVDEEWAKFFAENHFLIGLSLDGPKEIHDLFRWDAQGQGTFNRIRQTVTLLNRHKVEYNILCVVTEEVAKNANKVMNFFINNGFTYLQFIPCLDGLEGEKGEWSLSAKRYGEFLVTSFNKFYSCFLKKKFLSVRNFDNYLSLLAGYPAENCGMNGRCAAYFVVEGNGDVYPCDFYVLDQYKGGNVNENSLREIRNSEVFEKFVEESFPVSKECKECKWYMLCRGGCRRYREPFESGIPSLNFYCESYKKFFEECGEGLLSITKEILKKA